MVTIEVPGDPLSAVKSTESPYKVSLVKVTSEMTWAVLEEKLSGVLLAHFIEVSVGLRTKKTSRFDGGAESPDSPVPFSLGLSMDSVKYFAIGKCLKVLNGKLLSLYLDESSDNILIVYH